MAKKTLELNLLEQRLATFSKLESYSSPSGGWVKSIRTALGMTLLQMGKRLGVSKQAVLDMEKREAEGSITLKALREVGQAIDMQLVYGFVPNDGSLDALIEKKARELASQIVHRTSNSMVLEDQAISEYRLNQAIDERTLEIKQQMPKILWD
ncbi:MAG: mobile mystery protein A [Bacteroidetes bacterium]|nr:mobile mystery protein A [Bacteroidota bacterium]MDA0943836.1 mobile mystery protein A [Bacteroidota bacterium]MDA1112347.1 mobile mystery protein A [Bacteroidota bacterium]